MSALELGGMTLGVREGVIVLIALVAIYMVFVLLRMRRLRSKPAPAASLPSAPAEDMSVLGDAETPLASDAESVSETDESWERAPNGLADDMLRHGLEQELAQLRDEVDAIRGELAALREDLRQEVAHMHSAQAVSPIYGDAMQMAAAGYDPAMIADRCGLPLAKAGAVGARAKSQNAGGRQ